MNNRRNFIRNTGVLALGGMANPFESITTSFKYLSTL
jgi:hypothetical protein